MSKTGSCQFSTPQREPLITSMMVMVMMTIACSIVLHAQTTSVWDCAVMVALAGSSYAVTAAIIWVAMTTMFAAGRTCLISIVGSLLVFHVKRIIIAEMVMAIINKR
jgi:hypothetical protein